MSSQCKEYSLGECDRNHREPSEGYKWVSAARKKDIAWDVMRSWRKAMVIKEFEMLKTAFETKERPEGYFFQIRDDGVRSPSGREYLSGDTQESFLKRYSCRVTPIENGQFRWDLNFAPGHRQAILGVVHVRKGRATVEIEENGEDDEHPHRTYDGCYAIGVMRDDSLSTFNNGLGGRCSARDDVDGELFRGQKSTEFSLPFR